jgi:hypothetical protein
MISNKSKNNNGLAENASTEDEKLLILTLNDKNSIKGIRCSFGIFNGAYFFNNLYILYCT